VLAFKRSGSFGISFLIGSFSLFETFIEAFRLALVSLVRGVTEEFVLVSLRNVSALF
jgi:hypothetical protein